MIHSKRTGDGPGVEMRKSCNSCLAGFWLEPWSGWRHCFVGRGSLRKTGFGSGTSQALSCEQKQVDRNGSMLSGAVWQEFGHEMRGEATEED